MKNDGKAISQADSAAISATVEAVLSPLDRDLHRVEEKIPST
jgi:hypothetical protein